MRFNHNADTHSDAIEYFKNRGLQLLKFGFEFHSFSYVEHCTAALFKRDGEDFFSIYVLKSARGKGAYLKAYDHLPQGALILTGKECMMEEFLIKKGIPHICLEIEDTLEYKLVSEHWGERKAIRSERYYMNHIDEGLGILHDIGASEVTKKAYTLHGLVQSDDSMKWDNIHLLKDIKYDVLACLFEYRSVANAHLSRHAIETIGDIRLSPLDEVNLMLFADKLQNQKDFLLYHYKKHERSGELHCYFSMWIQRLLNVYPSLNDYYAQWMMKHFTEKYLEM